MEYTGLPSKRSNLDSNDYEGHYTASKLSKTILNNLFVMFLKRWHTVEKSVKVHLGHPMSYNYLPNNCCG